MNNAAINIGVYVYPDLFISLGYIYSEVRLLGSVVVLFFLVLLLFLIFLSDRHTVLPSG